MPKIELGLHRRVAGRVARWYIFKQKSKFGYIFWVHIYGKGWYILWPFGVYYCLWYILRPFGNLVSMLYIFTRFDIFCKEKSGNPGGRPWIEPWTVVLRNKICSSFKKNVSTFKETASCTFCILEYLWQLFVEAGVHTYKTHRVKVFKTIACNKMLGVDLNNPFGSNVWRKLLRSNLSM
jgi:hypothetical protein